MSENKPGKSIGSYSKNSNKDTIKKILAIPRRLKNKVKLDRIVEKQRRTQKDKDNVFYGDK